MTNYPYSQQIHDKILADWKDVPFSEENWVLFHPSIKYRLWVSPPEIYPTDTDLMYAMSKEHAANLYEQLIMKKQRMSGKERFEFAAKQFLGLE